MTDVTTTVVLLKAPVVYGHLLNASLFFVTIVVGLLLFIVYYLHQKKLQQKRKNQLRQLYDNLIVETIMADDEAGVQGAMTDFTGSNPGLLTKPFARKILIRELVKAKDSVSGVAAENLRLLYEALELHQDTLKNFASKSWHRKAKAIQQLAEMQQTKYLTKIYRETNSLHPDVRTEAQIAVVKLTGFKGLRFLNIVRYPVSQWQQLSLISQLQEGAIEEDRIAAWLRSENDTVVEFALRLIAVFKCYDLHDAVMTCLEHPAQNVQAQALEAAREISNDQTNALLIELYSNCTREMQLQVLDMLADTGGHAELRFFSSLLPHPDEAVRFRVVRGIQKISPAWSTEVIRSIENDPSFTYILSTLRKTAA